MRLVHCATSVATTVCIAASVASTERIVARATGPVQQSRSEIRTQADSPCAGQARSLNELKATFLHGKPPVRSVVAGTWAAIGFFGDAKTHGKAVVELDCAGLKRHEVFEAVMIATDAVVQIHVFGTFYQSRTFTFDRAGTLTFSVDFGGDIEPVYRCRMTERNTLACLIDAYGEGEEFKKTRVELNQLSTSGRGK